MSGWKTPMLDEVPAKIFMPVLISMLLFIGTFFGYILPGVESHLMERKREMIHALSDSALSSIDYYAKLAESGTITRDMAQQQAVEHLRNIRYGPDMKDYFWINDTHPRMIMHPYRGDLEGQDVTDTTDPTGMKLFQAFLETAKNPAGGYVNYHWQWQDDPTRIFSKISYVREYPPWHWVIGTGVYVEDVRSQVESITKRMTFIFLGILCVISLLSAYIVWQGAASESRRRAMEESLRKSESKYRLLAETAKEIILMLDENLSIRYANTAWSTRTGYTQGHTEGKNLKEFLGSDQQELLDQQMAGLRKAESDDSLQELVIMHAEGTTLTVEATMAVMEPIDHRSSILLTARDITERKRLELQAKIQQEHLMQTSKMISLGTLVSGVAHEINNPISSVMLNINVFERLWGSIQPVLDDYCRQQGELEISGMPYSQMRERMPKLISYSKEGVGRVKRIVGDLKEFSGQKPSDLRETVNLNEVVEKALGLIASLIKKATTNFRVVYDENLPTLQGNSQRLGQVVINLVVNGCQALTDPHQELLVTTAYLEESEEVLLEVRDGGAGMDEEILSQIKDPFFTTKRDSNGTGLGLSISDTIIRNHGGWLDFQSTPGKGTTATVLLPRYSPDEVIGRMI